MPLTFEVFTSMQSVPGAYMNTGLEGKPICRGIDTVELSCVDHLRNFYVATLEDGILVCMSYYQLLAVQPIHFNLADKPVQQAALSLALRVVKPTLLVAGNLFRHDVVFQQFVPENQSAARKGQLFHATNNYMISYTNASGIFLKDVTPELSDSIEQDTSYLRMPDDVSMELQIPDNWIDFTSYEKALKHKYLQRCRKIRKSFEGIIIREFNAADILQYGDEMEALYIQVARKQLLSMGLLNQQFFNQLKSALKQDYKVCGFFNGDKLVAFSSAIMHDGKYDMNYIGFDYAFNHSHNLYFNILFHCLENAMANQCHTLILGRTAPEAKAIMGCKPDYRFSYYKLRNVIVNWFYRMVSGYFREQQGEAWKSRHPFKSSYYAST